jgi:hypothetical protein
MVLIMPKKAATLQPKNKRRILGMGVKGVKAFSESIESPGRFVVKRHQFPNLKRTCSCRGSHNYFIALLFAHQAFANWGGGRDETLLRITLLGGY